MLSKYYDYMSEKSCDVATRTCRPCVLRTLAIIAASWAALGLLVGLAFRELTRHATTDPGSLGLVHSHTLVLGMFMSLILLMLEKLFVLSDWKFFKLGLVVWNAGLLLTVSMLFVQGLRSLWEMEHSAALAGVAGLGHIALTIGLFMLFRALFVALKKEK